MLFSVLSLSAVAQGAREKSAQRLLAKKRWDKVHVQLEKLLRRDSFNVPALYLMSRYYSAAGNPAYQLDSAYGYALKARRRWGLTDVRTRERWRSLPLDTVILTEQRRGIEKEAFRQASDRSTEQAFVRFIRDYPGAPEVGEAIRLRNASAFREAEQKNTWTAYQSFVAFYPSAEQAPVAQARYDSLLYEAKTLDRRLLSYVEFLRENPQSPHRIKAEWQIFELATATGTPDAFESFISEYPGTVGARRAASILFHVLYEDHQEHRFPAQLLTDSLKKVMATRQEVLVPLLFKGNFGFMNAAGKEVIPPFTDDIDEKYLCGNVGDIVLVGGQLFNANGSRIHAGPFRSMEDIGFGFLLVEGQEGLRVLHASGFFVGEENLDDALIAGSRMIATKKKGLWTIYTLGGRKVPVEPAPEIIALAQSVVFRYKEGHQLHSLDELAARVRGEGQTNTLVWDDARKLPGDYLLVQRDDVQGVFDPAGKVIVPEGSHKITQAFFGFVAASDSGFHTYNRYGEASEVFPDLRVIEPWVTAKTSGGWILFDPAERIYKSISYDSIAIHGAFAAGYKPQGIELHFAARPNHSVLISAADKITFLKGNDTTSCLLVEQAKKMTVYSMEGIELFSVPSYDRLQYPGKDHFVVWRKNRKGLLNRAGKLVLPIEYDAIAASENGFLTLLKGRKFGLYDSHTRKLIKPEYDKNIRYYSENILLAYKNGFFGFINSDDKTLSDFLFSDVLPWKDSLALVRQNNLWSVYNVLTGEKTGPEFNSFTQVSARADDRVLIVKKGSDLGVISSRKGTVIPVNFSDIVNVGSPEQPLYFTEKHVREADLFIVIYYDSSGRFLRREVYEHEDYDRIYCPGKGT